jgi:NADPH:quinone reductase-like Zn-dependent oxidoreductase
MKPFVRHKLRFFIAKLKDADLDALRRLIESGKITPVIDRTYPLAQASKAVAHVGAGHARGKVVITV